MTWLHQTSEPLAATVALGAISALAVRGGIQLQIHNRWTEQLNLYAVVSVPPGGGKSPVYRDTLHPVTDITNQDTETNRTQRQTDLANVTILRKTATRLQNEAAKDPAMTDKAIKADLWATKHEHELKPPFDYLAQDATPEALVRLLDTNDGIVAILDAEGGFFDALGRYAGDGKNTNLDPVLKAYSGDTIKVHRIKNDNPYTIDNPRAVIILCCQPKVLEDLYDDEQAAARGLTSRFLMSEPASNVGRRDYTTTRLPDDQQFDHWTQLLHTIADQHPHQPDNEPTSYQLHPQALEQFDQWRHDNEQQLGDGGRYAHIVHNVPKHQQAALRLAGLIHLTEGHTASQPVSPDTMDRGIGLATWWLEESRRFKTNLEARTGWDLQYAERLLDKLRSDHQPGDPISLRDIHRTSVLQRSHGTTNRDIEPVVELLVSYGHLHPSDDDWQYKRGVVFTLADPPDDEKVCHALSRENASEIH